MPNNPAHPSTTRVCDGLRATLEWLTEHPHIPISRVDSACGDCTELELESGRFELLAAAADVADALTNAEITVELSASTGRWCALTITGGLDGHEITAVGIAYDQAASALLTSLGTPPLPGDPTWPTTADHLRGLLAGDA